MVNSHYMTVLPVRIFPMILSIYTGAWTDIVLPMRVLSFWQLGLQKPHLVSHLGRTQDIFCKVKDCVNMADSISLERVNLVTLCLFSRQRLGNTRRFNFESTTLLCFD